MSKNPSPKLPVDGCTCTACYLARKYQDGINQVSNTPDKEMGARPPRPAFVNEPTTANIRFNLLRNGEPARCWMIVRINSLNAGGGPPNTIQIDNRPAILHTSEADATREMERLAKAEPGSVFMLFVATTAIRLPVGKFEGKTL